ncbi:efflux RND transporter periplasmic adaptor subunit [Thiohalorhabdus sp.]|uniref:efflux RND transporter periplasmic adaptor subunit n=1 Tax=Thiohalorhabdus sp. TaxID=3094134 RepID=UPI002FC362A6
MFPLLRHSAASLRGMGLRALVLLGLVALPPVAPAQDDAPEVATATAETAPIVREVRLTGTVTSPRVARVSTSVAGQVARVHIDSGDRVGTGADLAELDPKLASLQLRRDRAAVAEAEAELADARRRLEEARRLAQEKNIPASEVRSREAQVRIQEAALQRLQAEAAHQQERVARHRIAAPFDGVVSDKLTAPGEWIDPGTAVVELVAMDGLRLDFPAPQAHYPRIDTDTPVTVSLEALGNRAIDAYVGATIPVSDPEARTFTVRIYPEADELAITPGMSARATLRLATGREGVVVPRDALLRYPDGRVTVWTVANGGEATAREQTVETGLSFDGRVEIRSGIEAGARVVTRGNEALEPGQSVRLTGED